VTPVKNQTKKQIRSQKEIYIMPTNQQNKNRQSQAPGQRNQGGNQGSNQNDQRHASGQRDQSGMQQPGRDRDLDEQNQRNTQSGRNSDR
jgi:hypothetical protein